MKNSEGIGFLAALAPKNEPPPPPPDAKPKGPGSFFAIEGAELGDLNAILDFPGSWGLELRHAHARASLKQDGTDPAHPTFGFDAGPVQAAGGGWLRILDDYVLPFDRVATIYIYCQSNLTSRGNFEITLAPVNKNIRSHFANVLDLKHLAR